MAQSKTEMRDKLDNAIRKMRVTCPPKKKATLPHPGPRAVRLMRISRTFETYERG